MIFLNQKNATLCFSNELRFIVEVGSRFELLYAVLQTAA